MIDPLIGEDVPVVTRRTLRQFAALSVVVLAGWAAWHGLMTHRRLLAFTLAALALVIGVVGLVRPEKIRPIYSGLMALTIPIGRVFSLAMTAFLFYVVLTPLGLAFGLFGRDALHVKRQNRPTHWVAKKTPSDLGDYMRQ